MAQGERQDAAEAFEDYGKNKAGELLSDTERESIRLKEATDALRRAPPQSRSRSSSIHDNHGVKGFTVEDRS